MWHVKWDIGSTGPGIDLLRQRVCEFYRPQILKGELSVAPEGPFDADLKKLVSRIQALFNSSPHWKAKVRKSNQLKIPINETGTVDRDTRLVLGVPERLATDNLIEMPAKVTLSRPSPPTLLYPKYRAEPKEIVHGSAFQVENLDDLLSAAGLGEAAGVEGKRVARLKDPGTKEEGTWCLVPFGHPRYGEAVKGSECAALVQSLGVPSTNLWRRGPRVQTLQVIPRGTVIATLRSGVYLSDYSGKSHVGIFLRKDEKGLWMLDQFVGQGGELRIRQKPFGALPGPRNTNPVPYYVNASSDVQAIYGSSNEAPLSVRVQNGAGFASDFTRQAIKSNSINLTNDGTEYFVLVSDGTPARLDLGRVVPTESEQDQELELWLLDSLRERLDPKHRP